MCDVTRQRDGSMGLRRTKPTNGWLAGACCAIVAGLQCTMRRSMWLRMSAFSFESILTCASRYAFSRTCRIGSATLHGVCMTGVRLYRRLTRGMDARVPVNAREGRTNPG